MEQLLQVGVISSTHGVRGEVKVYPTTDDVRRFKKLKSVILDTGRGYLTLEIEGVKFFKQFVILKFKDIDNINDIENKTNGMISIGIPFSISEILRRFSIDNQIS